ncbi:MAG TPA: hypothetical protein VJ945_06245 [Flavobacteriaceae bacterium]|nr:hypothetical protein [Flavobacteriaceae bacterium]
MIILPATLETYASLKDKTVKLVFYTLELTPDNLVGIASSIQKFGYLAFKEDRFKDNEKKLLEGLKSDYDDHKLSKGQRLRNVLYRLWQQQPDGYEDFNLYYEFRMEKIIDHFKTKFE